MFCAYCGNEILDHHSYCVSCGMLRIDPARKRLEKPAHEAESVGAIPIGQIEADEEVGAFGNSCFSGAEGVERERASLKAAEASRLGYETVEEIAHGLHSIRFKTEEGELVKIFHSLDDVKAVTERLEWLKSLGDKDDVLSNAIAMPSSLLAELKPDEVGYVCKPSGNCTLDYYIRPEKNEKLFKWYYEKTGGIEFRLKIAYRIAARLQQVHAKGICLVDICPGNTTLQAFAADDQSPPSIQFTGADSICSCTRHAQSTGDPRYGDPLVLQRRSTPSSASGTFSYAVMLFEMLTTCHPFYGEDAESLSVAEFYEELKQGSLDYIGDELSSGNKNELFEDMQIFLPEELAEIFGRMFIEGKMDASARPTLSELKAACIQSLKRIIRCDRAGCGKGYPYNSKHVCPFCNRPTSRVVLARLRKGVVVAETYVLEGVELGVYRDDLPLTIEDLVEVGYDDCSYQVRSRESSLAVEQLDAYQGPRWDAIGQPIMEYTVTEAKLPLFVGALRTFAMDDFVNNYYSMPPGVEEHAEAVEVDVTPWGAEKAYQIYGNGKLDSVFLLYYGNRVVRIGFYNDWGLTDEQMATVGEKLG